jgi:hypothetical protein
VCVREGRNRERARERKNVRERRVAGGVATVNLCINTHTHTLTRIHTQTHTLTRADFLVSSIVRVDPGRVFLCRSFCIIQVCEARRFAVASRRVVNVKLNFCLVVSVRERESILCPVHTYHYSPIPIYGSSHTYTYIHTTILPYLYVYIHTYIHTTNLPYLFTLSYAYIPAPPLEMEEESHQA